MSCLCGSQKRSAAPSTINPVNIGNLCFLFGVEGALCQFLDLIPETIKAVLDANKKPDDADEIFFKWVRKFAKTGYNIVIDEATGDIDLTSFCSNPPPPLPDDITFQDVFVFMAEVVEILDIFFKTNDILSGNDTRLIDKVTGFWLFKQWYENCECKKCPDPPDPPDEDSPTPPPPFNPPPPFAPCPDGCYRASGNGSNSAGGDSGKPCKNLRIRQVNDPFDRQLFSCHGYFVETFNYLVRQQDYFATDTNTLYRADLKSKIRSYRPLETSSDPNYEYGDFPELSINRSIIFTLIGIYPDAPFISGAINTTESEMQEQANTPYSLVNDFEVSYNGGPWQSFYGNSDQYPYPAPPPCICPPPSPPPQEFCDLYPDHPDCIDDDDDDDDDDECETENVLVGEFTQCKSLRKPKTVKLFKDVGQADTLETLVIERTNCDSIRGLKVIQYLDCTAPPPPDPCEDVVCDVSTIFADLDAIVANQNVGFGDAEDAYSYLVLPDPQCCKPAYIAEIERYLNQ
jgi:hypothetical protein